jgi:hypothetical protein
MDCTFTYKEDVLLKMQSMVNPVPLHLEIDMLKHVSVLLIILLVTVTVLAVAHNQTVQQKSYEFHREGHVIDVNLDHGNTLTVAMDNVEIGTRNNFCILVP